VTVTEFEIRVPDSVLEDLRQRLSRTRWPRDVDNEDWRYGANRAYLEELVDYWRTRYDWRAVERRLNSYANYKATIDGQPIHFIHERGRGRDPIPLILTHGWPWSYWDYEKTIRPLTDPAAFGGDPADCFDVIVPSLPGFGWSTPVSKTGINFHRTADLWVKLMREELGYGKFAAGGGDWGQLISTQIGHKYPEHLVGVHLSLTLPLDFFTAGLAAEEDFADDEKHYYQHTQNRMVHATSHIVVQTTEPQTLSYGLHDSPVGLLAWLLDRRRWWSDSNGDIESRFTKDEILTLVMLYWVTESFVSSARFYWEAKNDLWQPSHPGLPVVTAPTGVAIFPQELVIQPKSWIERYFNLRHLTYMKSGGHFAPAEEPQALVEDIRDFFRPLRGPS
jgi:pimeloyl-ACP methyl ester carboxylesterase